MGIIAGASILLRKDIYEILKPSRKPNEGIFTSVKNTFSFTVMFYPVAILFFLIWQLIEYFDEFQVSASDYWLNLVGVEFDFLKALASGIAVTVLLAGTASWYSYIKHFTLRLLLYFTNAIPWNYARFLNYCTDRLLLQRVGGRYRFIHRLIQERFAAMPLNE
ncbi:hypothetical protein IQ254_30770 [Nodosilinea sp. LEGE 07088]|uniref:hypothetical protein n=1 Tax=Nodosilinea sp. LEGE 07088 TaxID=2777968 RepID=UPI00187FF5ED|nr:hypothetical protein [Nodosilinea sp. LEGE 07088]MBE9141522.1 hypothetical protein [Nodosilinea sp. LEGE 07088]